MVAGSIIEWAVKSNVVGPPLLMMEAERMTDLVHNGLFKCFSVVDEMRA
ncbi:MAG TPA: hypothetical protein VG937_16620 [Polyangiaceae bacterium]|nr:hypothetical protein [Polyangiaceae bacterium]